MTAAIPSVMFSSILRTQMETPRPLYELFSSLNRSLCRSLDKRTFVCFSMAEIDPGKGSLRLANSGLPYPLHYHAGGIDELKLDGYPLGIRPDTNYDTVEVSLAPGDYFVFVSDGIPEAVNADGEEFGERRLQETIRQRGSEGQTAEELVDNLFSATLGSCGEVDQQDDMTCVAVRVVSG